MTFSSLEHYMTEVISNIELRFGYPTSEKREDFLNRESIELDVSYQKMLLIDFEDIFDNILMRKNDFNFFELCFHVILCEKVTCNKITRGTYSNNGIRFPKVTIHGDYLNKVNSNERVWIDDEMITQVGTEFDNYFDYEFVEFSRIKK